MSMRVEILQVKFDLLPVDEIFNKTLMTFFSSGLILQVHFNPLSIVRLT